MSPELSGIAVGGYGDYAGQNYGNHCLKLVTARATVYFSYDTPVAVTWPGGRLVSENDWGTTTGRHLNWIDGGSKLARKERVAHSTVLAKLAELGL